MGISSGLGWFGRWVMGGWKERDPETKKSNKTADNAPHFGTKERYLKKILQSHLARQRSDPSRRRRKASCGFV